MPVKKTFTPGEFCWNDLNAHDLEAAASWYGELFGWTPSFQQTQPGAPPYAFFMMGEAAAAAAGQMNDEMKAMGIPQCWNSYVAVADCAASEARAAELGATVTVPTMEIPGHGKLCFILDPEGASIAMWQQLGDSPGVVTEEPGAVSWNELLCRDVAKARDFYGKLFGWTFVDMPMGDVVYTMIRSGEKDVGGMMAMDDTQFEGVPNHWMVYFAVADCEATVARVTETGGSVHVPPTEIQVGKFAVLGDAQGGGFSIMQLNEAAC